LALFFCFLLIQENSFAQNFSKIDSVISAEVINKNIAGGVALIMHNGKIVYDKAFGFADVSQKVPMTTESIFRIASQTKAIVSIAFLQLVQQNKIGLDDPIENYIPAFKNQQVAVFVGDSIVLVPKNRSITPRDLLSHQSGISSADEYPKFNNLFSKYNLNKSLNSEFENLDAEIAQIAKMPLVHQPGERFSYGLSTNVIGRLIEILSKQPLDKYLYDHIFKPLNMMDTYFYIPKNKQNRLVKLYTKFTKDSLTELNSSQAGVNYPLNEKHTYFSAIGGLVSTTHDYAKFLSCLLNEGKYGNGSHLVSKPIMEQFLTNQLGDKKFIFGGIKSLNNFGLGVGLTTKEGVVINNASEGSFFWGGAFNTAYMVDPKRKLITVFYFQRTPFVLPPLLTKLEKMTINILDKQN
jgi:CubicO group peptidase (beta-lactamase class C family)